MNESIKTGILDQFDLTGPDFDFYAILTHDGAIDVLEKYMEEKFNIMGLTLDKTRLPKDLIPKTKWFALDNE